MWVLLAAVALIAWLRWGAQLRTAGRQIRAWRNALIGVVVAGFLIMFVMPHLGH